MKKILLFLVITASALGIANNAFSDSAPVQPALTIQGTWQVEVASPDPVNGVIWKIEESGSIAGGAFVQFRAFALLGGSNPVQGCGARADTSGICKRLRIHVNKPTDQIAVLAIQFPGRTFGQTSPSGSPFAEILLNEMSLSDIGQAALQLTVNGAKQNAYGLLDIRPTDQDLTPFATAALSADNEVLNDGAQVKSGWHFLFFGTATDVDVVESPTDFLSLCVIGPDAGVSCSSGNQMNLWVKEKGTYFFWAWNTELQSSVISIQGV